MGNVTKVFGNVSFRIVALTLWFVARMLSKKGMILNYYFLFWDIVPATKLNTFGKKPKEIVNEDLGYVSQIFLPKTMGNDPKPCGFVYVIAAKMSLCILVQF